VACTTVIASRPRNKNAEQCKDPSDAANTQKLKTAISVLKHSKIVQKGTATGRPRIFDELPQNTAVNDIKNEYQNFITKFKQVPPQKGNSNTIQQPKGDLGLDPLEQQIEDMADGIWKFEELVKKLVNDCGFLEQAARGVLGEAQDNQGNVDQQALQAKYDQIREIVDQVDLISDDDSLSSSSNLGSEFAELFREEASFQLMKEKYSEHESWLRSVIFGS